MREGGQEQKWKQGRGERRGGVDGESERDEEETKGGEEGRVGVRDA